MSYPINLDITARRCLVVGAGKAGFKKARGLCEAGAQVCVVSPIFDAAFDGLQDIERVQRDFVEADVDKALLAIAATDDAEVNAFVFDTCRKQGILCCRADKADEGDFSVPARIKRGSLLVTVSTHGAAPALAKRLRHELESTFPEAYSGYVDFLRAARTMAKRELVNEDCRLELMRYLASREGWNEFLDLSAPQRDEWLARHVSRARGQS